MPASARRKLISVEAAAERLNIHSKTIRRYIAEGRITGYRVGGKLVRVAEADVDALIRPIPAAPASQAR